MFSTMKAPWSCSLIARFSDDLQGRSQRRDLPLKSPNLSRVVLKRLCQAGVAFAPTDLFPIYSLNTKSTQCHVRERR